MEIRFQPPSGEREDLTRLLFEPGDSMVPDRSLTAEGSAHDPASSLCFRSVRHSTCSHQGLLSSPEILAALDEVLGPSGVAPAAAPAAALCAVPVAAVASPAAGSPGQPHR
jgi:hypothetical protein